MSISFPHLSTKQIRTTYNAFGILWFVPVYLLLVWEPAEEVWFIDKQMEEANWVPRPLFWMAQFITVIYATLLSLAGFEPSIPVFIFSTWDREAEDEA